MWGRDSKLVRQSCLTQSVVYEHPARQLSQARVMSCGVDMARHSEGDHSHSSLRGMDGGQQRAHHLEPADHGAV